jgi:hypothetical protein
MKRVSESTRDRLRGPGLLSSWPAASRSRTQADQAARASASLFGTQRRQRSGVGHADARGELPAPLPGHRPEPGSPLRSAPTTDEVRRRCVERRQTCARRSLPGDLPARGSGSRAQPACAQDCAGGYPETPGRAGRATPDWLAAGPRRSHRTCNWPHLSFARAALVALVSLSLFVGLAATTAEAQSATSLFAAPAAAALDPPRTAPGAATRHPPRRARRPRRDRAPRCLC